MSLFAHYEATIPNCSLPELEAMLILSLAITSAPVASEEEKNDRSSDDEDSDLDRGQRRPPKNIRSAAKKADDSDSDFDL